MFRLKRGASTWTIPFQGDPKSVYGIICTQGKYRKPTKMICRHICSLGIEPLSHFVSRRGTKLGESYNNNNKLGESWTLFVNFVEGSYELRTLERVELRS